MERSYQSWSSCEEGLLMLRLAEKTPLDCIATEFGRSLGAIRSRRNLIAFRLFKQGRSMRDLTVLLSMTYSQLEDVVRSRI